MGVAGDKKRRSGSELDEGNVWTLMAMSAEHSSPCLQRTRRVNYPDRALCAALKSKGSECGHVFHYGHETLVTGGYLL